MLLYQVSRTFFRVYQAQLQVRRKRKMRSASCRHRPALQSRQYRNLSYSRVPSKAHLAFRRVRLRPQSRLCHHSDSQRYLRHQPPKQVLLSRLCLHHRRFPCRTRHPSWAMALAQVQVRLPRQCRDKCQSPRQVVLELSLPCSSHPSSASQVTSHSLLKPNQ